MGFLNTNSLPHLVEKLSECSNIKINGNSYGSKISTVIDKIVEKADNVTKAINQEVTNDSYSFKVGQGNNINVTSDVQDSFSDLAIKGVTYQNLLGKLRSVSSAYVISDDKYSLNLSSGNGQPMIIYELSQTLKPNTKYTLIFEVKDYTAGYPHFCFMSKDNLKLASTSEYSPNSIGIKKAILSTKSDVDANTLRILPRNNIDNNWSIGKNILIFEGDHTNNLNLPSYFEGIVGVGDKSKNLFNGKMREGWFNLSTGEYVPTGTNICSVDKTMVLPNQKYYINKNKSVRLVEYRKDETFIKTTVINGTTFTTSADTGFVNFYYDNKGVLENDFMLSIENIEYQPHHEGYKIEILSNGKNLINKNECKIGMFYQGGISFPSNAHHPCVLVKVKPNTKYRINRNDNAIYIEMGSTPTDFITSCNSGTPFVTTSNTNYLRIRPHKGLQQEERVYNSLEEFANSIQLEEGVDNFTNYEPYVEDKTQILLDEPLMKLPNGAQDEITRDGKLIRRVGKVVLDGSFDFYAANTGVENKCRWMIYKNSNVKNVNSDTISTICSHFSSISALDTWYCTKEGISQNNGSNCIYLFLERYSSTLDSSLNKHLLRTELQTNPVTLYYELAEPIITSLSKSQIRIFKDGAIKFNTLVAPESTHVVQLNKSAQIERSIREVQSLDSKVEKLENFYDDMMLETNHKLSLLDYDFEYTRSLKESEDI